VSTPPIPPPPPDSSSSPYAPPASGAGPAAPSGARLPWEERDRLGIIEALVQTIRLLVTDPIEAYGRLRQDGDITSPILFGVILGWISLLFSQVWNLVFGSAFRSLFGNLQGFEGAFRDPGIGGAVAVLVLGPILFLVGLFIGAGILHLCLMMVGALDKTPTGFEGTLKVLAYAQVTGLAAVVPLLGGLVAMVWSLVLQVLGFATVHRTTQGRALVAVLIPLFVCCVCLIVSVVFFGAMIAALFAGAAGRT
jgi:hypothetical protein